MSRTDDIKIGQIDERFMRYIEINEEKKRIELLEIFEELLKCLQKNSEDQPKQE